MLKHATGLMLVLALSMGGVPALAQEDQADTAAQSDEKAAQTEEKDEPEVCDGSAQLACNDSRDYCKKASGQCEDSQVEGVCTRPPEICTEEYEPVCGCDGVTYGNACEAASEGMNVDYPGECSDY